MFSICDFPGAYGEIAEMGKLFEVGQIKMSRIREFGMEDVVEPHRQIGSSHTRGKIVLRIK